jgi:hypothetical protein
VSTLLAKFTTLFSLGVEGFQKLRSLSHEYDGCNSRTTENEDIDKQLVKRKDKTPM